YIRSGLISHDNPQLVLSGSYDKTIKLWDLRNNKCNMTIDHGAPVEEVLMFPGGGIVLSAGKQTQINCHCCYYYGGGGGGDVYFNFVCRWSNFKCMGYVCWW